MQDHTAPAPIDGSKLPQPLLADHPEWCRLWTQAWELAAAHIRTSRGRRHMDAAWDPDRNYQWVWDTCFMALYCRYAPDEYPGIESLDNFYELQRPDGYISMTYDLNTGEEPWPDRINPPLFAWLEWEYARTTGDMSRLPRVVPHIERLMQWIDENRRTAPHSRRRATHEAVDPEVDPGTTSLYYFRDCGSSGMDDSPRTPRVPEAGQHFDWIDLSSQMALSFRCLSRLHSFQSNTAEAARWEQRATELGEAINTALWSDCTHFYHDRSIPSNLVAHKTVAGFWPMLAGICPADRLDHLVRHLADETSFARPMPVPSLSADDLNYSREGVYWCGGVWAPTNYMVTRGLMLCGRGDDAHRIACQYLDGLERTRAAVEPHTLWECNSPEYDRPGLSAQAHEQVKPDFVGWTGIGPTAMLIENVLGIDLDRPAGRLTWHIRLTEEHGMQQFPLGAGAVADLHCAGRTSPDEEASVDLCSDLPLTVCLHRGEAERTVQLKAGESLSVVV